MSKKAPDKCAVCGSDSLFSGYYDEDDYAVPQGLYWPDATPEGVRYTTFCNDCGAESP